MLLAEKWNTNCNVRVSVWSPFVKPWRTLKTDTRRSRRLQKSIKTPYFGSLGSFKVIDVDTAEKLVTGACCDRQHAHAYLQLFSRKTGQQR